MQPPEKKRPKYRIVSDGTELGTHLLDADGAEVDLCIKSVKWEIAAGGGNAIVTLELWDLPVDVVGTAADRSQHEAARQITKQPGVGATVTGAGELIVYPIAEDAPQGGDTDGR